MGQGRRFSWPTVFVFGVWAALTAAALWFVAHYGRNAPFADECQPVPYVTGFVPVDVDWLFAKHNEHRIPLPRLLLVYVDRLFGDWRASAFLNVALLSAAALVLTVAARRRRGCSRFTDAIFPAVLLGWGHWENVVSGWQLQYTLTALFVAIVLATVHVSDWLPAKMPAAAAAVGLAGLPLCGVNGLLYAIPLSVWAVIVGWRRRWPLFAAGVLALALSATWFPHGNETGIEPQSTSPFFRLWTAAVSLGTPIGAPFLPAWLLPGIEHLRAAAIVLPDTMRSGCLIRVWPLWTGLGILLTVLTGVAVAKMSGRAALGYVACFAGTLLTAIAIGWGRGLPWDVLCFGPEVGQFLTTRYALLLTPLLTASYLMFDRLGWTRLACVPLAAALIACVSYCPAAMSGAADRAAMLDDFIAALHGPEDATTVADRFVDRQFVPRGAKPELEWRVMLLRGFHYPCLYPHGKRPRRSGTVIGDSSRRR